MVNKTEKKIDRAEEQARTQLEAIVGMVARLEHSQECDNPDPEVCELTDAEICAGLGLFYRDSMEMEENRETYHDQDEARQAIEEDPLSVEVRTDWHTVGAEDNKPTDYNILLCTGGPACRILGELTEYGDPQTARIQHQDWGTPWIELVDITSDERAALLTYAQQFYFIE